MSESTSQLKAMIEISSCIQAIRSSKEDTCEAATRLAKFLLKQSVCSAMRSAPQLVDYVVTELIELIRTLNYSAAIVFESLADRNIYHASINRLGAVEALIMAVHDRLATGWQFMPSIKYVMRALQRWLHQTLTIDIPLVKRVFAPRGALDIFCAVLEHESCSEWSKSVAAEGLAVGLHEHEALADERWRRTLPPLSQIALEGSKRHRRAAIRALVVLATDAAHRSAMAAVGGAPLMLMLREFYESRSQQRCDRCGIEFGDGRSYAICGGCRSVLYCSIACQKEHWRAVGGHRAVCKRRSAEWCTRLHVLVGRSWPCAEDKIVRLLRDGADVHARATPDGPSPLCLARRVLATRPPAEAGIASRLVVSASEPWSHATHRLFPTGARARAVELLLVGYALCRAPLIEPHAQAILDAWVHCIMPHAVHRSSTPLATTQGATTRGMDMDGTDSTGYADNVSDVAPSVRAERRAQVGLKRCSSDIDTEDSHLESAPAYLGDDNTIERATMWTCPSVEAMDCS